MTCRWVSWAVGGALVVVACVVLLRQATVSVGATGASCGSAFDVVAGRVGWRDWWSADVAEAPVGSPPAFTRAKECARSVNAALALAGGLTVLALAEVAAFETVRARRLHVRVRQLRPAEQRMRRLGWIVTAAGAVLTVAGAIGLVLLVADARSTLFLYVGRPVVASLGCFSCSRPSQWSWLGWLS